MTVLVVGATGELGTSTVRELRRRGRAVRAFVRPGSAAAHLPGDGVTLAHGDLRDPASVTAALRGAEAVVLTANSVLPRGPYRFEDVEGRGFAHLVDAARAEGVGRFVMVSVPPTPYDALAPAFALKHVAEERLRASGLSHTILQPSLFLDGWLGLIGCRTALVGAEAPTLGRPFWFSRAFVAAVGGLVEDRGLALIPGDGRARHAFVAVADVARFVVGALDAPVARDATLRIGGPEALSWTELVAVLGEVLGHRIRSLHTPEVVYRLQSALLRPWSPAAANLMTLNRIAASVDTPFTSGPLAADLGFELQSTADFLRGRLALAAAA